MAEQEKSFVSLTILVFIAGALVIVPAATAQQGKGQGQSLVKTQRPRGGWEDNFDRTTLANPRKGRGHGEPRWIVASGRAPGSVPETHIGYYDPAHVGIVNGYLVMLLTQESGTVDSNTNGVISNGALIYTQDTYGYGTYEWRMRMSSTAESPEGSGSPVSGSVSAGFVYVNNSETEIDFEFSGHVVSDPLLDDDTLYMVNWNNITPGDGPTDAESTYTAVPIDGLTSQFKTYRFVWEEGSISFYVDEELQAFHTTNVPSAPAHFMINHWGTNRDGGWGGAATLNIPRYFYVDGVKYTPLP